MSRPMAAAFACLFFGVALTFSTSVEAQFTLPKLVVLRAIAPAILLLWIVQLRRGEVAPIPRYIAGLAAAFAVWLIATTWFAVDATTALEGMHGRYNGLLNDLILLLLFVSIASMLVSRAQVETLIAIQASALVPVALFAVVRALGFFAASWPEPRPASTIGNPVQLAAILVLEVPFVVAFLACRPSRTQRVVWSTILLLFLWAIGATLSRGPWVGLAAAAAVMTIALWTERRRGRIGPSPAVAAIAVGAVLLTIAAAASGALTRVTARVESFARIGSDAGMINRFTYIGAAVRMLRDHPLTGVGIENFGLVYPRYRPVEPDDIPSDQLPTMVHNDYLQLAVSAGIPALVMYLALVGSIVVVVWRGSGHHRIVAMAFVASIVGYLVQQLSGWQELPVSVFFWSIVGAAVAYSGTAIGRTNSGLAGWRTAASVAGVGLAIGIGLLATGSFREFLADQHFFDANHREVVWDWPRIAEDVAAGLALAPGTSFYEDAAGVIYMKRLHATGDGSAYRQSLEWLARAEQHNPLDPYILIHRIDLETIAIQRNVVPTASTAAVRAVDRLEDMDPNNATVHDTVARLRLAQGLPNDALPAILRAEALRPHHVRYHMVEGDARRALGDRNGAIAAYRKEVSEWPISSDPDRILAEQKLVLLLIETGQHAAAISEAESALASGPDAMLATLLGFAYVGANDVAKAKVAFVRALEIDPTNAAAQQGLRATTELDR